jgi:hypothetical protein
VATNNAPVPSGEPELLTADDAEAILTTDDRATAELYVPEWKKRVTRRQLTGAESIDLAGDNKNGMLRIVAASVVDPASGQRIFKDWERLRGKSAGALQAIQEAALKLNGFSTNAAVAAAVAAAAKNG